MMGYVLEITGKNGDTDVFAAAYDALQADCLANAHWFGWCETELRLPRRLSDATEAFAAGWDVARIFTACAELRAQRRGDTRITLLLTENATLTTQLEKLFNVVPHTFTVESSHRILTGTKPKKPVRKGSAALIEVAYPRELDYDIAPVADKQMLVAEVRCYYDEVHRLKFVRYCNISPKKIGKIEESRYE